MAGEGLTFEITFTDQAFTCMLLTLFCLGDEGELPFVSKGIYEQVFVLSLLNRKSTDMDAPAKELHTKTKSLKFCGTLANSMLEAVVVST
jgi:hypothetical protein